MSEYIGPITTILVALISVLGTGAWYLSRPSKEKLTADARKTNAETEFLADQSWKDYAKNVEDRLSKLEEKYDALKDKYDDLLEIGQTKDRTIRKLTARVAFLEQELSKYQRIEEQATVAKADLHAAVEMNIDHITHPDA